MHQNLFQQLELSLMAVVSSFCLAGSIVAAAHLYLALAMHSICLICAFVVAV